MFYGGFALGFSWLLPLALVSAVLLLWLRRRAPRTDLIRASTLFWLIFLCGNLLVFSVLQHFNSYYTAVIVPAIAALVGTGAIAAWTAPQPSVRRWLVPLGLALSLAYTLLLLNLAGRHWAWLQATVVVVGAGALFLNTLRALTQQSRLGSSAAAIAGVLALLLTPACGSLALDTHQGGPYSFAFSQRDIGPWSQPSAPSLQERYRQPVQNLLDYVEPRTRGMRYLLATGGSVPAAALIAATGQEVIPMGGYSGQMPTPTIAQLQQLIAQRQLRYFLIDPHSHSPRLRWIVEHCRLIPGFPTTSEISQTKAQLFGCVP